MEKLDLSKGYSLQSLENEVGRQIRQYKKERKQIKESKEPRLLIDGQKDYEIKQLRDIFEKNIAEIDKKYRELGNELIEEQEQVAQKSQFIPTQSVREKIDAIADDFTFFYMTSNDETEKRASVSELSEKVKQMTYDEKGYFRRKMPEIIKLVNDDSVSIKGILRGIAGELKDVKTEEEAGLELLKQNVNSGPLTEYKVLLAAEAANERSRRRWEGQGGTLSPSYNEVEYKPL